MSRAHLYRPVLDPQGNLLSNLVVRVLEPGTTTLIAETVYAYDDSVSDVELGNPQTTATGIISIYLAKPRRVRLGVRQGTGTEVFYDDLDVTVPGGAPKAADVSFDPTADNPATDVQAAIEAALTKDQADLLYAPNAGGPAGPDVPDPETGAPRTIIPKFTLQAIISGPLSVNTDLIKPGLRVPQASKMFAVIAHAAVAPGTNGTDGTYIDITRWNNGAYVENVAQVYIPGGQTVGVEALDPVDYVDFAKGDMVKFVCWAPGVTPAEDVSISLDFL